MGLFFNSDIKKLYLGSSEVEKVYLGSTLVWSAGLPVGTAFNFEYTGSVQSVELPRGKYKLQCWGAQGGSVTGTYAVSGSKGGYSEGVLTLTKTTTLYVFVGGQGTSYTSSAIQASTSVVNGGWNGGGAGRRTSLYNSGGTDGRSFPRGGGGATDISTVTSALSYSSGRTTRDAASLLARCIVAGGGAGASARYTSQTTTSTTTETIYTKSDIEIVTKNWDTTYPCCSVGASKIQLTAGYTYTVTSSVAAGFVTFESSQAGGYITKNTYTPTEDITVYCVGYHKATYEGQTTTITVKKQVSTTSTSTSSGKSNTSMQGGGTSGKGQYPGTQSAAGSGGAFGFGANQASANYRYCSGGGGGGWYGGGEGQSDSSTSYVSYSGGGSGFVNTAANASYRPSGYTGLQLDSGTTTAGNTSHPSTSGGSETGHSGNGYARITVIE